MGKFKTTAINSTTIETALQSLTTLETSITEIRDTAEKSTEGKMGFDKSNFKTCTYWLDFVKNNADVLPGRFETEDFDLKTNSIQNVEKILEKMEGLYAQLKNFRDDMAIDVRFYTSRAILYASKEAEKDSILNLKIKSAPLLKAESKKSKSSNKNNSNNTDKPASPNE